ncbi:hypothetical protein BDW59DRAFT_1092 [Aspergillus cavernicola]|uniref:Uncharacterized protein n=1 Tax=Aspergillus cavernicola TaxID=176166 RepID=A0ABR4J4F8_9EURO
MKSPSPTQGFSPSPHTSAPDFLCNCFATCLQEIRKLSRYGGPDLSDTRDVGLLPIPKHLFRKRISYTNQLAC